MARSRRRTQWIDAIQTTSVTLSGAAAPGTVLDTTMISEAEMENVGGGATLLRTIGDIWTTRVAGSPVVTHTLFLAQNFPGAVGIADWDQDAFQREQMLATWLVTPVQNPNALRTMVDIRSKRKLTQGVTLQLSSQNHSVVGNDVVFAFHLRFLILLP